MNLMKTQSEVQDEQAIASGQRSGGGLKCEPLDSLSVGGRRALTRNEDRQGQLANLSRLHRELGPGESDRQRWCVVRLGAPH